MKDSIEASNPKSNSKETIPLRKSIVIINNNENQIERKSIGLNTSKIYKGPLLKTDPNYDKYQSNNLNENQLIHKDNGNIKKPGIDSNIVEDLSQIVDPRKKLKVFKPVISNEIPPPIPPPPPPPSSLGNTFPKNS